MQDINVLLEPLRAFLLQLGAFMPKLLLVVVILFTGWLIAKTLRMAAVTGMNKINLHVLTKRGGMDDFLQRGGSNIDATNIIGWLVYWLVMLAALVIASNSVGLDYVTDLLGRAAILLSRVVLAVIILVLGSYFAYFVDNSITAYGKHVRLPDAALIGRLTRFAIIAFIVLIALDQLNIGGDLIRQSFLIVLGGVVLALALAFGFGGRAWAAALLARWWPLTKPQDGPQADEKEAPENRWQEGGKHE